MGFEPTTIAWEARTLPLSYARSLRCILRGQRFQVKKGPYLARSTKANLRRPIFICTDGRPRVYDRIGIALFLLIKLHPALNHQPPGFALTRHQACPGHKINQPDRLAVLEILGRQH